MVILDTCAVIELCQLQPSLSKKTFTLIEERACILSISFAEIACKVKLKKLAMSVSIKMLFDKFSEFENIEIVDIGVDEWLASIDLDWHDNKDPVDRMLVAFAMQKQIPIVTSDGKIKSFYKKTLW